LQVGPLQTSVLTLLWRQSNSSLTSLEYEVQHTHNGFRSIVSSASTKTISKQIPHNHSGQQAEVAAPQRPFHPAPGTLSSLPTLNSTTDGSCCLFLYFYRLCTLYPYTLWFSFVGLPF
jgi:hypothetical protein